MPSSSWISIRVRGGTRRGRFHVGASHGGIDAFADPDAQGVHGPVDRVVERLPLPHREGLEDVVAEIPLAGVPLAANADPKARKLGRAEPFDDRSDPLLASGRAPR